jgi:hypothetical protein
LPWSYFSLHETLLRGKTYIKNILLVAVTTTKKYALEKVFVLTGNISWKKILVMIIWVAESILFTSDKKLKIIQNLLPWISVKRSLPLWRRWENCACNISPAKKRVEFTSGNLTFQVQPQRHFQRKSRILAQDKLPGLKKILMRWGFTVERQVCNLSSEFSFADNPYLNMTTAQVVIWKIYKQKQRT